MDKTTINLEKEPEVENPVFVEGLAGIGHIGRNTVSYIADQTEAEQIGEIKSHHFPPHTVINDDATVEVIKNKLYQLQRDDARDLILLEGNAQASTPEGHHEVAGKVTELAEDVGSNEILTIGGYGTGEVVEKPEVFGAVTTEEVKEKYSDHGIEFEHDVGQIVGISGLLIGNAQERGINGICLLGETPGFLLSDPKSTEKVLETMEEILELDLDYSDLDDKVEESQEVLKKLQNLKKKQNPEEDQSQGGDLGYIG
ncbi:proteasome assembly chaperone family protein [Candidatus Nanohalobium constans]|uniref:Proteasome assembly chaperone (PAC2) family protein n=1 Tax=Candidatus Nanohalobium constans TaxID=2565781 RepID=A0A5Q0UF46_9ARCH|nr:proteasome assembly chaperone family protein [Candidatus Nanohalobium constans]QGA80187.1 proteasome assembly chaperone (PAC2) family protein [Candidatus Nanohalobium constans]